MTYCPFSKQGNISYLNCPERARSAIYQLIANGSFGPDEIKIMTNAYEAALIDLGIADRNDPFTELIAKSNL
jgi:hypothetical protein